MTDVDRIMALADQYATQRQHAHYPHEVEARQALRTALEQALSARVPGIESIRDYLVAVSTAIAEDQDDHAQALLREVLRRLAAPQPPAQEARVPGNVLNEVDFIISTLRGYPMSIARNDAVGAALRLKAMLNEAPSAQKARAPVASKGSLRDMMINALINAAPQPPAQREWVGLTDAEIKQAHHLEEFGLFCDDDEFQQIVRWSEAKLRERNGGAA